LLSSFFFTSFPSRLPLATLLQLPRKNILLIRTNLPLRPKAP
jgi:hypothetical protein